MFLTLKRSLKLAWLNFRRNIELSLVAVFVIAISLFFLIFTFIVKDFSEMIISNIKEDISVSVYLKEGIEEETILEIKEGIQGISGITNVYHRTREEAFNNFIERHKDNPILMAALAEVGNPFPQSISISSDTKEGYETVIAFLEISPHRTFFEKIDYKERREIIDTVFNFVSTAQRAGLIIALIMGFVAILIIFNIVRLSIYGMKEEISIMRLVGASKRFIASSFIFQGIIIGIIGVLINILIIMISVLLFAERINVFIPLDISKYLITNILFLLSIQFGVAIILGALSSLLAINRHLKI